MTQPALLNRLTFRQLQVFQTVYRQHSYSRAAAELGLTQPAVSAQIRQLEQALGQSLFKYAGKTLHILPPADALAESIGTIFGEIASLQMALSKLTGTLRGELNIAAVSTAQYIVPHILARFRARYPEVRLRLRVVNRNEALAHLAERSDDLVIMGMAPEDTDLTFMSIMDNDLLPIVWPGHPLLNTEQPTPEAFSRYQVLMREPGSGTRMALEKYAHQQQLALDHKLELGTSEAIKQGVMAQLGVAVLPRMAVQLELQSGLLAVPELPGFPLRHSWGVVQHRERYPTPITEAFMQLLRELLPELEQLFNAPLAPRSAPAFTCLP
ncbi:LysR family transcriptional regulator [Kushneria phosphatilytica]|uniref:LysR family transcriptional regulator n=1 Tax=Kushneria phosphatilytica TaxID=657387 RepID=A0A1S1NYX7_9GAMM|nr:LysR family transcriptional regulator [Kushneria phosphatilytica]OHV13055.1 LysR family transcriptional regulator [Kushneria phosphatilytica]QEL10927.1 LysR family transcriptional regulator [Kushneria phosphatilytica]